MIYAGSYKIINHKNINSIPEFVKIDVKNKNGIVFVLSDMFLIRSEIPSIELVGLMNKTIVKIYKQQSVFKNVEAIVLNGNIIKNCYSNQGFSAFSRDDYIYTVLKNLLALKIPVYYVRGDEDCYISNQTVPVEMRSVLNFCNALQIGNTLFVHGHNSLPFENKKSNVLVASSIDDVFEKQKLEAKGISEDLDCNVVFSNSRFNRFVDGRFISTGNFLKHGVTAINISTFELANV